MDTVIRAIIIYLILIIVFRVAGRRTLSETTTPDLVLLLIISETIQEALIQNDTSLTTATLLVATLICLELLFLILKYRFPKFDALVDGRPLTVIKDGEVDQEQMTALHINEDDILESSRLNNEIDSLSDIKHAVVEKGGQISIIPK